MTVPHEDRQAPPGLFATVSVSGHTESLPGIAGVTFDRGDTLAMHEAVQRARSGSGPTLIDARAVRVTGHSPSEDV